MMDELDRLKGENEELRRELRDAQRTIAATVIAAGGRIDISHAAMIACDSTHIVSTETENVHDRSITLEVDDSRGR